jgi:signal transduction histidine kinase
MMVLILIGILVVITFGGVELYNAAKGIEHDTSVFDLQDSRYLANYVHMFMGNISSSINVVATSPDTVQAAEDRNITGLREIADNLERDSPQIRIVYFEDSDGGLLYSTMPLNTSYQAFDRDSKTTGSSTGLVTGLYYNNAVSDYALSVIYPIQNGNGTVGRVIAVVQPEALQESIQSQVINPSENVIVVDNSGNIIARDNMTPLLEDANISQYPAVQHALRGIEGVEEDSNTWDRQSRITAYYPAPQLGWGVIVSTPVSAMYRPLINEVEMMAGMLLLFLLGLIVLGYFASAYLTTPIIGLSNTIKKISDGEYGTRARLARPDEIGELAMAFDDMMDELERARKSSDDAKARAQLFVDLMGHDINNMNQVALGYLEMARDIINDGGAIGQDKQELLDKPIVSLQNSSKLIDTVRKLQRIKEGTFERKEIDIGPVLEDVIAQHSHAQGRSITINYLPASGRIVVADELLRDVFSNIIGNAIKHSTGRLTIDITVDRVAEQGQDYYRVVIEDNGPGISDELKDSLFDRAARGKTKATGKGLGLYLIKALIDEYNGMVWVEDRVSGDHTNGSRFVVIFPAAKK